MSGSSGRLLNTSLFGLDWFKVLGIHATGVQHISQSACEVLCGEFAAVFDSSLGQYTGLSVLFDLDLTIMPIQLKARWVPFTLKLKIDEELDQLISQGVLEPISHVHLETPIATLLKYDRTVCIRANYKCTLNKVLQQHAYPVLVVSHLLVSLAGGRIFPKKELPLLLGLLNFYHAFLPLKVALTEPLHWLLETSAS